MNRVGRIIAGAVFALGLGTATLHAEDGYNDGTSAQFYEALKGKKVVFIPISMGMDIAAGFAAGMQRHADQFGFSLQILDPNWSADQGVQAITQSMGEKPDLLVVQNVDMQAYSRVLKQAMDEGIKVLQVNVKSTATTTAHVGVDWYRNAELEARELVRKCSPKNGGSGKIAILQGTANMATNFIGLKAFQNVMAENPDMTVVSDQAADWDASKAHSVVSTVLRQNPDLCGYFGFWDGQDAGLAAAIREAGLKGKVYVVSQGAGEKAACTMVADGSYDFYVSYNIGEMSKHINDAISVILQMPPEAATQSFGIYMPAQVLTKDTLTAGSCWSLDEIKKGM